MRFRRLFVGCTCNMVVLCVAFLFVRLTQTRADESHLFGNPQRVRIRGYNGIAMEPFISRDGKYLFFNNSNEPNTNTDLFYAERVDDITYQFRGELKGVNTPSLEGVATMDRNGTFYFVSTRSYATSYSTIYRGQFHDGSLSHIEIVPGISDNKPGRVNFDVEVSVDGNTLYYVESTFKDGQPQRAQLAIAHRKGARFERDPASDALLKNVNAEKLQYAACISGDEKTLFFTRLTGLFPPTPSIYLSTRPNNTAPFGKPMRVAAADGFVEGPTLSPDEKSLYFHKKEGSSFAIFRVTRK